MEVVEDGVDCYQVGKCQYSLCLPTEGWPGWVGRGGWLRSETVYLRHPSQY